MGTGVRRDSHPFSRITDEHYWRGRIPWFPREWTLAHRIDFPRSRIARNTHSLEIAVGSALTASVEREEGWVKVHYTGWLTNGTVFDSSVARGEPITFGLDGVVKGWQEGIPGMKVGGVRKLVIPPEKAYGSQSKEKIPANSTLVFEVELLEVQ